MRERINHYIWDYDACDPGTPRSSWRHFLQILWMVLRDLMGGMVTLRAMSLVYTTLLSIVPLLAVSISVLKGFGVHDQLEPTLAQILAPIGEQSAEISARIVGFVENMKMRFSDYLSVIMVGPVLVFSAVGITASLGNNHVVELLNSLPYMNNLLWLGGKLLPFVLVIAAFTFIYLMVPNTRVQFRSALYGAVVAGLLWQMAGIIFTAFVGGSSSYTAIYSGLAILLVFMIWLYLSWLILLTGASISFYHQHPEYLKWKKLDLHLSARMRDQLSIARAHDRPSEQAPDLETLAAYQHLPGDVLRRMLDALQADGLLQQSADDPPRYLPAATLTKIRLVDILRSARQAEDEGHSDRFHCDAPVASLLAQLEQNFNSHLADQTLADLLQDFEGDKTDEDSLV
jgi:membrane protein